MHKNETMTTQFVLGLDLGGTKIAGGVVSSQGALLSNVRLPTPAKGVRKDVAALFDAAHAAASAARIPWRQISAVGVGVPGAFDPRTETVWAPNLPGWSKTPLKNLLEKALQRPTFVEGDRNMQALAEAWLGVGARNGMRNLVFLTVGTGIGAGLISEGRLIPGAHGVSGAAGWMVIDRLRKPEYARLGCFEALGAGPAMARIGARALKQNPRSLIGVLAKKNAGNITAEVVAAAARRGDKAARRVLREVGTNLGLGVANIVSFLNPEVVVLGGGLARIGNPLLVPLRRSMRQWGQPLATRQVRVVRSCLGDEAGILGAARYAFLRLEEMKNVSRKIFRGSTKGLRSHSFHTAPKH
ncbi:MAG: ROK family protein [Terriglobia bacterium]|jgi:glucokinase